MSWECEMDLGGVDGEPIEGFTRMTRVSAGDVKCSECDRAIESGQSYEFATGECDDDEKFESLTCADCNEIAKAFQDDGRWYGALWDQLEETGGEEGDGAFHDFSTGCLTKLESASAKAYLMDRYRRWKGISTERPQATPLQTGSVVANKEGKLDDRP